MFAETSDRSNNSDKYTGGRVIAVAAAATPRLRTRIIGVNDAYRAASAIVCVQLPDYTADTFRTIRAVGKSPPLKCRGVADNGAGRCASWYYATKVIGGTGWRGDNTVATSRDDGNRRFAWEWSFYKSPRCAKELGLKETVELKRNRRRFIYRVTISKILTFYLMEINGNQLSSCFNFIFIKRSYRLFNLLCASMRESHEYNSRYPFYDS